MAINVGELEVRATADTRDASLGISGISEELRALQRNAKASQQGVAAVATSLTAVAGEASGAAGSIARFANQMMAAFATGGAIGIGLGAAVGSFQMLSSAIRSAGQDAAQLRALEYALGVTREEVDDLRHRFRALGHDVSQRVAAEIMQAGREAGYSAEEIRKMAGAIKQMADLQRLDAGQAAKAYFQEISSGAGDVLEKLRQIAQQRQDAFVGRSQEERLAMEEINQVVSKRVQEEEKAHKIQQEIAHRQVEILGLQQKITEHRRRWGDVEIGQVSSWEAAIRRLTQEIEALRGESDAAVAAVERLKREEEDLADAARQAAEAQRQLVRLEAFRRSMAQAAAEQRRIHEEEARRARERAENSAALMHRTRLLEAQLAGERIAELRELAEEEIRLQEEAAARGRVTQEAAAGWIKARRERLARDIRQIEDELAAAEEARQFEIRLMRAKGADDQVEIARITAEREIAEEQRKVDGLRYTWEQFYEWRQAREEELQGEIARIREREMDRARGSQQTLAKDFERELKNEERMAAAGASAGFAFVGGFKRAIEKGEVEDWLGAIFTGIGAIASVIPGGQLAGTILSGFGGLFHDGGMVGVDGRKKALPRYHDGGMIVAHRGLMLPQPGPGEVPIMAQLGEGILSRLGVATIGGPDVVRAANEGRPIGGGPNVTTIYMQAFDPLSMLQVMASTVEPAQYRRGMSRQDSKTIAMMRRRISPPRAGR